MPGLGLGNVVRQRGLGRNGAERHHAGVARLVLDVGVDPGNLPALRFLRAADEGAGGHDGGRVACGGDGGGSEGGGGESGDRGGGEGSAEGGGGEGRVESNTQQRKFRRLGPGTGSGQAVAWVQRGCAGPFASS